MMATLSNYAIGMSNGQAVDPQQMINYATNLGFDFIFNDTCNYAPV